MTPPNAPTASGRECPHLSVRFETVTIQPFTAAVSFPMPSFQRTRCEDCGAIRLATGEWLSSADEKAAAVSAGQAPEWTLARWTLDQAVQDAVAANRRVPFIDTLERLRDSIDDLIASRAALLAARREVRALETALVDRAASGAEIERAVKTFRSLENQRSDFAAMVEVLDEYERNRRTREARPNATRPFPWRAVVNAPDDAQVVCGEHGNPSTFAQIAECHTAADAEFIVEACNAAALAAAQGDDSE